jgi:hypothetical protein
MADMSREQRLLNWSPVKRLVGLCKFCNSRFAIGLNDIALRCTRESCCASCVKIAE